MSSRWVVTALVNSGRLDPEWTVDEGTAERVLEIWAVLPIAQSPAPEPPPLGYRGLRLHDDATGREWLVFAGVVVTSEGIGREDGGNDFARAVLGTAPAGALPPWLEF